MNKNTEKRFKTGTDSKEVALQYFYSRSCQLLHQGWSWNGDYIYQGWGLTIPFVYKNKTYSSCFIFKSHRGKGHLTSWVSENRESEIFTLDECGIEDKLKIEKANYVVANQFISEVHSEFRRKYDNSYDFSNDDFLMNILDKTFFHEALLLGKKSQNREIILGNLLDMELSTEEIVQQTYENIERYPQLNRSLRIVTQDKYIYNPELRGKLL